MMSMMHLSSIVHSFLCSSNCGAVMSDEVLVAMAPEHTPALYDQRR